MLAPRIWLAALGAGTLLLSCGTPRFLERYTTAEAASLAGDWPRAAELWHEVYLSEDPKTPRPILETANALYQAGDSESACGMLDQGLQLFPYDVELLEYKGMLLERCGYQRAAESIYARLVAVSPDHVAALSALARLRLGLGLERAAEEPLQHLVKIGRADAVVYEQLAEVQLVRGRPLNALESYGKAIELGSDDPVVLLTAAQLACEPGVTERYESSESCALDWLTKLVDAYPQYTTGHYRRGELLARLGRMEEAKQALRRAVETDPSHLQALVQLVRLHAADGEADPARALASRALELQPDSAVRADREQLVAELD